MGCNFYLEVPTCKHCGASKRYHLGKSSHGWTFSFHGLTADESPTGKPVRSYAAWKKIIKSTTGRIVDEEGRMWSFGMFDARVKEKNIKENLSHHKYCQQHHPTSDTWEDRQGNSFSGGEFC